MDTVLMIAVVCLGFYCCYLHGIVVGSNDKKLPKVELKKPLQDARAKREAQKEIAYVEAILRNIDNYDGTGFGQEDLPGR